MLYYNIFYKKKHFHLLTGYNLFGIMDYMTNNKSSKFGLGVLIGAVTGALAGIFYAPKSGEKTRQEFKKKIDELQELMKEKEVDKKVEKIFGKVTDESKRLYWKTQDELIETLAQLKEKADQIDKEKYLKAVDQVVEKFRKETKASVKTVNELKKRFINEWQKLPKSNKSSKSKKKKKK